MRACVSGNPATSPRESPVGPVVDRAALTISFRAGRAGSRWLSQAAGFGRVILVGGGPGDPELLTVKAVRLEMNTLRLSFNTQPGRSYVVKVCEDLSAPDSEWTVEYASQQKGKGWAEYSNQPFVADGDQTAVRVPVNRNKAFYKIVMVDE